MGSLIKRVSELIGMHVISLRLIFVKGNWVAVTSFETGLSQSILNCCWLGRMKNKLGYDIICWVLYRVLIK